MRRAFRVLAGLVLTLAGLALAAVGGFGAATFGPDGRYQGDPVAVASDPAAVALVADVVSAALELPFSEDLGEPELSIGTADGRPVFLGLADTPAVDEYLYGAPYDLLVNESGWSTIPVPGVGAEVGPPQGEGFWRAFDAGPAPTISLSDLGDGGTSLVIMNADASAGVAVEVVLGFVGPRIFPASVAAIAVGVLLVLIGVPTMLRRGRGGAAGGAQAPHQTARLVDLTAPVPAPDPSADPPAGPAPDAGLRPGDPSRG
jgi:hypothetical protein